MVFGCVDTVGPQAGDIARTAWLAAGLPEAVPGVTVDRQCGSSQQAVHFAAQAVLSGTADLVVAGGVQNMSMIAIAAAMSPPYTDPFSGSAGWRARYGAEEISQFRAADLIADKWGISRAEMERYALASHQRAVRAIGAGRVRRRDRAVRRRDPGRVPPPGHHPGEDGRAQAAAPGRDDHRRAVQPDRRRRGGAADRLGPRRARARAKARAPGSPTCPRAATTRC